MGRMSIIYLLESQKLPIFSYSRDIKFSLGQCFLCSIHVITNVYEKKNLVEKHLPSLRLFRERA